MSEHSREQAIILKSDEWEDIQAEVDDVIERSILEGNPQAALRYGYNIYRDGKIRGVKLAKLLYELDEVWQSFETDDAIEDAVEKEIGVPKDTFKKYSNMYRYVLVAHPELAGKPIEGLIRLTAGAREGEFDEKDWGELALAHNKASMLAVRDRVRDTRTSGHGRIFISRTRDGYLRARRGKGESHECGYLPPTTGNEIVDIAVERIVRAAGIEDQ